MGLIIGGLLLIAFALWTVIAPRHQWLTLNAWRYRDPDANEPSDLSYNLGRAAGVGTILLVVVLGGYLIRADSAQNDAEDIREARERRFGTTHVELAALPPATVEGTRLTVWRHVELGDENPYDLKVPPGTNLLIAVDGVYRVDGLLVRETADQVTVTVTGACIRAELLCDAGRTAPFPPVRVFPVTLAAPLGGREFVNQT